jgi:antitoxin component YwqK of YwqJK toxin-antitoxin module
MFNKVVYIFFITILSVSCQTRKKSREIIIGNEKVEGLIGKDTVFNGLIKFYDNATNRLKAEANYIEGKLTGERREYYENGSLSTKSNYQNDKMLGNTIIYDEGGSKIKSENYYYDIQVGESIEYKSNKPANYHYFSFGGEPLFSIKYDTSKKEKITDLQSKYFFINKREYADVSFEGIGSHNEEVFMYMPNPPLYNFRYYLVMVDSLFSQVKLLQELNNTEPWAKFTINSFTKADKKLNYAIKLVISDSISGGDVVMYKKL